MTKPFGRDVEIHKQSVTSVLVCRSRNVCNYGAIRGACLKGGHVPPMTLISLLQKTRPRHEYYQPLQPYKSPGIQPSKGTNVLGNSRGSSESDVLVHSHWKRANLQKELCIPLVRHTPLPSRKGLGPRLGLDEQSYAYSYAHAPKQSHYLARCHVYAASQRPNCLWPSDPRPSCSSTL
ncbi:hypothetical protein M438DRAFT_88912 [Aureobasidium pullulans EXF-150]|uniref:Uncharacterized protein n=1 Tax=Aureobasidium pullulans EXF-150 TaxID=1043002 RepID=A0A074XSR7_AURPU|nr:uncharacterized protein M438DRAFT_88912 [Aureobasidium pullulans EXF-150]KEQ88628.1 hypothetical protein M438DRAFT_88912 [Aureobasidium pullulans EXF-150]